jgi:hypothetical protein
VLNDLQAFAHTSPVYVHLGEQRVVTLEDARFCDDWIEKLIAQTMARGKFASPEHRKEVLELFRRAQQVYKQLERQAAES